jgi:hypothetical protein
MLLLDRFRHVVLMLNADPAGQQGSRVIATRLAARCKTELIHLESGQQPDHYRAQRFIEPCLLPRQTGHEIVE